MSGIPPVSDYAHHGEEARAVWYEENRYDMTYGGEPDPDRFYDREYDLDQDDPDYEAVYGDVHAEEGPEDEDDESREKL